VNVTSLTLFAQCPRKYYLQRYIGWTGSRSRNFDPEALPEDTPETTPAAELGSFVHEILAGKSGAYPAEAHALAEVFLQNEANREVATATRSAREWDFIVDIDGMLIRGTVDLWFEKDNRIRIIDYKTDDITSAEAPVRAKTYAPQLALYAIALGNRATSAQLHFLRAKAVVDIPIDDNAIARVHHLIARLKQAQDTPSFDLNEGPHCRTCQFYRNLCPANGILNS
jgi:ATP-dependent helicase/nuclease subunit A